MYYLQATERLVKSKGIDYTIKRLTSGELSNDFVEGLEADHVLRDGFPCLSLIIQMA